MSKLSNQFVIHVPKKYDYHFDSKFKNEIVQTIVRVHLQKTKKKKFSFYFVKDAVLNKYVTNEDMYNNF